MREVPQALLDNITASRQVNARLYLEDDILRFDEMTPNDTLPPNARCHDVTYWDTGALRVAIGEAQGAGGEEVWYQYVPDLDAGAWPAWQYQGLSIYPNSLIGLRNGRLWRQGTDGSVSLYDWNGSGFTQSDTLPGTYSHPLAFAPVSYDKAYIIEQRINGTDRCKLWWHNATGDITIDFHGAIYIGSGYLEAFDAETWTDNIDYLYYAEGGDRKTMTLSKGQFFWSPIKPVLPLDVVDDTSYFMLGGVARIQDQIVLTGVLKRANGTPMHIYTLGPKHYTMGRDMFIAASSNSPYNGGKLVEVGATLYYIGLDIQYKAAETSILGAADPARSTTTAKFSRATLGTVHNSPSRFGASIDAGFSHTALREGAKARLEAGYGGEYTPLGTFILEDAGSGVGEEGQDKRITGRGEATHRLDRWKPDAFYDYWSQTKQYTTVGDYFSEMVRAFGDWKEEDTNNYLILDELNQPGIMYAVSRPSRGWIVRGTFKHYGDGTGMYKPDYGLITNFYRGSRAQLAENWGVDIEDVPERPDYGWHAIMAVYGKEVHQGGEGIAIYRAYPTGYDLRSTMIETLDSVAVAVNDMTLHQMMLEFREGAIRVYNRVLPTTDWTLLMDIAFEHTQSPWGRDEQVGRAGVYMNNRTYYGGTLGFNSEAMLIPLWGNGAWPTTDVVLVESEEIIYNGKSPDRLYPNDLNVVEGYTLQGAPHDNPYSGSFTGHEIYCDGTGEVQAHDYYNNCALVVVDGPGKGNVFKVTDYDWSAPRQWVVDVPVTLPDTWMDFVGDPAYGHWEASASKLRFFVEEDPSTKVRPGSVIRVCPALYVTERGAFDTESTFHPDTADVHIRRGGRTELIDFECYSQDVDLTVEDMAREIARKAGVQDVTCEHDLEGDISLTHTGWDLDADIAQTGQQKRGHIAHFKIDSGEEIGMISLNQTTTVGAIGSAVTIHNNQVKFYYIDKDTGDLVLEEKVTLAELMGWSPMSSKTPWFTVTMDEDFISIWANDTLLAARHMTTGTYGAFIANNISVTKAVLEVKWSALDLRVDNFFMEMGTPGMRLLARLIGEKQIYFRDKPLGGLHLFANRKLINSGDPITLSHQRDRVNDISELATRIRLEGAEMSEVLDVAKMKEYGNYFDMRNSQELLYADDFLDEAQRILTDVLLSTRIDAFEGAADPRVEVDDIINVNIDGTPFDLIVDRATFDISLDFNQALFDMRIEGRKHG